MQRAEQRYDEPVAASARTLQPVTPLNATWQVPRSLVAPIACSVMKQTRWSEVLPPPSAAVTGLPLLGEVAEICASTVIAAIGPAGPVGPGSPCGPGSPWGPGSPCGP